MTITFGWWLLPAIITTLSFVVARIFSKANKDGYQPSSDIAQGIGAVLDFFADMLIYGIAIVISLVSWLIYFVVN